MTVATTERAERRKQGNLLIDELQKERIQVWALYSNIAELKPFTVNSEKVPNIINEFAQLMVDYISLGHFGIYQRILDGNERRRKVLSVAEEMYPEYSATTETAVSFNDKYVSSAAISENIESLEHDLSKLGEDLAKRIEIEDKLCDMLMHRGEQVVN